MCAAILKHACRGGIQNICIGKKKSYITTKMHVYIGSVKTTSPYIVQGSHGSMCSAVISSKEDN